MADRRALAILLTLQLDCNYGSLSDLSLFSDLLLPLFSVLVECWERNEADETFLDGYTSLVCETE
jgi:hypothetical protein